MKLALILIATAAFAAPLMEPLPQQCTAGSLVLRRSVSEIHGVFAGRVYACPSSGKWVPIASDSVPQKYLFPISGKDLVVMCYRGAESMECYPYRFGFTVKLEKDQR